MRHADVVAIRPREDYVLLRYIEPPEKTEGGIVLPDVVHSEERHYAVVAVGPGLWNAETQTRVPLDIEVGDEVVVGGWAGDTKVKLSGIEHFLARASVVVGVVVREGAVAYRGV